MYVSRFGPVIEEMLEIRHRSGLQLKYIEFLLRDFDSFCFRWHPDAVLLTKEIAEAWIHCTDSSSRHHMSRRVTTMKHIGEYQQSIGLNAYVPNYGIKRPKAEEPHLFTDEQLVQFFSSVDTKMLPTETYPYKNTLFPVFFRLVYCCGLRCGEACNLKVSDVDFAKGTISIRQAKGMNARELPVSEDILDLCFRFDQYYRRQFPGRIYFFKPDKNRECMNSGDVGKIFDAVLKKAGLADIPGKKFTPHGLRHLFAVQNIRKCADEGEDFYNWIQYLSKYMGHKHIRYTLYYLHITSQLFPVYREKLNALEKGIGVVYAQD